MGFWKSIKKAFSKGGHKKAKSVRGAPRPPPRSQAMMTATEPAIVTSAGNSVSPVT